MLGDPHKAETLKEDIQIQVKLSLCLIKYQGMKKDEGMDVEFYAFLVTALDEKVSFTLRPPRK